MTYYEQKYNDLLKEFEQYKKESIKWSVEDFTLLAEDMGIKITRERCQVALEDMINYHNPEYGISWITLENQIEAYAEELKPLNK
jgi:hypothetical protein